MKFRWYILQANFYHAVSRYILNAEETYGLTPFLRVAMWLAIRFSGPCYGPAKVRAEYFWKEV